MHFLDVVFTVPLGSERLRTELMQLERIQSKYTDVAYFHAYFCIERLIKFAKYPMGLPTAGVAD